MQSKIVNFSTVRLLCFQNSSHKNLFHKFTNEIKTYISYKELTSVLHKKDFDCLFLDMENESAMDVLENVKENFSDIYVIACSSDSQTVMSSIEKGADSVLLNPLDKKECEDALFRLASHLNMHEIFNDTYYIGKLTSYENLFALQEKIEPNIENALLRVCLSGFKSYEIFYGSEITNKILVGFGNAIEFNLPVNAELLRTNEDEFSILLKSPSVSQEKILAEQLKAFFELTSIEVEGFFIKVHTYIGIARGFKLLQKSKVALSEAKDINKIVTYNENSDFIIKQKKHIKWVKIIQDSIYEDRVKVFFQPIMSNIDSSIDKYEVLCRIEDKNKKLIMPNDFIPSVIISGQMSDITRIIIDKSFKYFKDKNGDFSINITKEDFQEDYLYDYISYKCDYYDIDPKRVYIEILENISHDIASGFVSQIENLKKLGCNISIDDFGIDGSNFSRMLHIEADILKIDGHFIQKILHDKNAKIIVENIVNFSKKIGAKTVAEYVDSQELLTLVKRMNIDYSQGFYIGKPSPSIY